MITEIHAQSKSEDPKIEPNAVDYCKSNASNRRHLDNEPTGPLSKKIANNMNNVKSMAMKKSNQKDIKKRTLKRL